MFGCVRLCMIMYIRKRFKLFVVIASINIYIITLGHYQILNYTCRFNFTLSTVHHNIRYVLKSKLKNKLTNSDVLVHMCVLVL